MTLRLIQQNWPQRDLEAISQIQSVNANEPFIFNGSLNQPSLPNQISFVSYRFIRSVSITSADDDSAVSFTVTGIQNGAIVSQIITGGNATTVNTTISFDVVTSVVPNADVVGVSIGTGDVGYLPIIQIENNPVLLSPSVSITQVGSGDIQWEYWISLENMATTGISFDELITLNRIFSYIGPNTGSSMVLPEIISSTNCLLLQINLSPTPDTDSLVTWFGQGR